MSLDTKQLYKYSKSYKSKTKLNFKNKSKYQKVYKPYASTWH